ncbi:uncharacterized protein LOC105281969 isoform X2 [Ooceraea biroi]|uniref:uncharacterized protein LOC105281969 isoform X2 n=1 Tax=Ooceraea biroi TaxID=2015173 RepID=UPI000F084D5A|nr:uncharacterized protein LOC105281969 isoform X2 [Ooceraea biroi]
MGNKSGYSLSRPRLSRKKGYVQRRRLLRMMQAEKAKHSKTTEDANDKCNHFDQFVESPSDKIDTEDTKIDISIKQFLDSTSNTMSASTDNIPEPQLFTHSIINTHPVDKMLKMECIEEPLSETQLSSTMKLEDMTDYDRVAATLEQLVEDYGGKLVRQTGVISYEYTLPANQTATPTIVPDNPQISNVNVAYHLRLSKRRIRRQSNWKAII